MSGCDRCDNGWLEIDDMPAPCRRCASAKRNPVEEYTSNLSKMVLPALEQLQAARQSKPGPVDQYLRTLAQAMGLGDWVLVISDEPADDGTVAEIDCTLGQRHARVYLCEEWLELDAVTQRDTLVHELVHAHLAQLRHLADALFATVKGGKQAEVSFHLIEEYATEAIAQAWAPMLPLPIAKRKKKGAK